MSGVENRQIIGSSPYLYNSRHFLIWGPSGCGKRQLAEEVWRDHQSDRVGFPFHENQLRPDIWLYRLTTSSEDKAKKWVEDAQRAGCKGWTMLTMKQSRWELTEEDLAKVWDRQRAFQDERERTIHNAPTEVDE